MKAINKLLFLFLLTLSFAFMTSCSEDDEDGKNNAASIVGTWVYESASLDLTVNGDDIVTYLQNELGLPAADAEEFANLFEEEANFFEGGRITFNANGTYSSTFDGETDSGTWSLNSDATEMTIDAGTEDESTVEIFTLTSSKLSFGIVETESEDLNDDGTNETLSIDFRVDMTKQ